MIRNLAVFAALAVVVAALFTYERMLWKECLVTNSWFYCFRTIHQ